MKRWAGIAEPAGDLNRLTTAIGLAIAFFGLALIGVIVYAGWSSNKAAGETETKLVDYAIDQSIARVLNEQKSIAWWDDAVKNIDISFNADWIDEQIGLFLTEIYGQDELYIFNSQDKPIYGYKKGGRLQGLERFDQNPQFKVLLQEMRERKAKGLFERPDIFGEGQDQFHEFKGVLEWGKWRGHILVVDGRPAIVTAITICPTLDPTLLKDEPYALLSIVFIDDQFVRKIGRSLLMPDLALVKDGAADRDAMTEPFVADDGTLLGMFSWKPRQPGAVMLNVILPLVLLGILGAGLLTALMLRRLRETSAELARREAEAQYTAKHDSLSGLPNRHYFAEQVDQALQGLAAGTPPALIIAYLDIDRFKDINDTLGHQSGDALIRAAALRLREELAPGDVLARFGGDEFAILRTADDTGAATDLAARLSGAFAVPYAIASQNVSVTASIGFAFAPEHGRTVDELMQRADIALYAAKAAGRDQAQFFSDEMERVVQRRRTVEIDLQAALKHGGLSLYYQPLFSCSSNEVTGVEALLRWTHPTEGPIAPSEFIPIAEEAGLMPALGSWVLEQAFADSARLPDLEMSINLSPAQLRNAGIEDHLASLIQRHGVRPGRIIFEITENVLLNSSASTTKTMAFIRNLGFKIALDDFGTGYSSLRYLCDFKFDRLKIDRSFVTGINQTGNTFAIAQSAVQLGRHLGMDVVAEGVETEADATVMRFLGCTALQGYYFARPMPIERLEAAVREFARARPLAAGGAA